MVYEYACSSCDCEVEIVQRITDKPVLECPRCTQPALQRLISGGTAVIFKGSGWARDLYSKEGK